MIRALVFDLDDTLVQTERLKALSYAKAAHELRPNLDEGDVVEAFKDVVGGARNEVAQALMQRFDLEPPARAQQAALGLDFPWQVFLRIRQRFYDEILADEGLLQRSVYQHNLDLLRSVRSSGYKTGLATMSHCHAAQRVLDAIGARDLLDVYVAREDVERSKPDPEIYVLAAKLLAVQPQQTLVIEDSPNGARAALGAGMNVIVVTTPFTRQQFAHEPIVDRRWIVDDPGDLRWVVNEALGIA
jgi:HAD superfamily hydrolase (TIGR01509 family)